MQSLLQVKDGEEKGRGLLLPIGRVGKEGDGLLCLIPPVVDINSHSWQHHSLAPLSACRDECRLCRHVCSGSELQRKKALLNLRVGGGVCIFFSSSFLPQWSFEVLFIYWPQRLPSYYTHRCRNIRIFFRETALLLLVCVVIKNCPLFLWFNWMWLQLNEN